MMISEKACDVPSVLTAADPIQLPPVRGKHIFLKLSDKDSIMKKLSGFQLWNLLEYV